MSKVKGYNPADGDMIKVLLFHPVIQALATLLAGYVLCLGLQRFRSLHLRHKVAFKWQIHVKLGLIALGLWLFIRPTPAGGSTMFSFSVI